MSKSNKPVNAHVTRIYQSRDDIWWASLSTIKPKSSGVAKIGMSRGDVHEGQLVRVKIASPYWVIR
jgi:hypothetical protein